MQIQNYVNFQLQLEHLNQIRMIDQIQFQVHVKLNTKVHIKIYIQNHVQKRVHIQFQTHIRIQNQNYKSYPKPNSIHIQLQSIFNIIFKLFFPRNCITS